MLGFVTRYFAVVDACAAEYVLMDEKMLYVLS